MHVCLLNDSFPPVIDGVANTVLNYANVLTEDCGDTVAVATPRYPGADYSGYPYEVVPYSSIDTSKIIEGYRAGYPFDEQAISKLAGIRPDIIHTHCPVASAVMARVLRDKTEAPIVFTYHTKFDVDIAKATKAKLLQEGSIAFLVNNISACDEVWAVSDGAGKNLQSLGYKGDYRVMVNGVDFAKGRVAAEDVASATAGYDLPDGVPVFLFVGRLMTYKGIPIILDALKILAQQGKDFRMVLIGGGQDAEAMQKKAIEAGYSVDVVEQASAGKESAATEDGGHVQKEPEGKCVEKQNPEIRQYPGTLPGKVIFLGAIHDRNVLRAWNTRADLFLFPSTYDTNGIVVREAAACGLASVLIRNSCAAEGITEDHNGFFVDENAASMAELLLKLYPQMDHVHQVGQNAMDEIYISWEDSVKKARERYGEILELTANDQMPLRHEKMSDALIGNIQRMYDQSKKISEWSQTRFSGMMSNFYDLEESAEAGAKKRRDRVLNAQWEARKAAHHLKEEMRRRIGHPSAGQDEN